MKRLYIFLSLLMTTIGIVAQDYYWYGNERVFLQRGDERYVLVRTEDNSMANDTSYLKKGNTTDTSLMWGIQKNNVPLGKDVIYVSPSYLIINDSSNMYVTERFYVKLKQEDDYAMLVDYASRHNVEIVEEETSRLWYVMTCTEKSKGNALEMANMFHESALFASAEPEFINAVRHTCVDDSYFNQQWNLQNTGQHDINNIGVDINYCDAHTITTGVDSIRIAVIDDGIASHFDVSYLYSYSFDAHSGTYPAQVYGSHGTQCAGIIGAHADNNYGVAGIASDCPLLSISFNDETPLSKIAAGIEFAVDQNAAVLSNSWLAYVYSERLNDAIDYALTEGRNGKGCVVAFAAGNGNTNQLAYPANYHPDILAVGAMNPYAERANYSSWGSNYGDGLDVMAPGVNIPTTIPSAFPYQFEGSFTMSFEGTSAACPHVAAVAGLVLSVNPNLTQKEVSAIIESTAQKVGGYVYGTTASHGNWNSEMGYGLVDAYAAVSAAQTVADLPNIEIEGPTYLCDSTYYYVRNAPEGATFSWSIQGGRTIMYDILGVKNQDSVLVGLFIPQQGWPIQRGGDGLNSHIFPHDPYFPIINDTTATLSVTVTYAGVSYTAKKTLYINSLGTPQITVSDTTSTWTWRTARTFTISNCTEVPDDSITWVVKHQYSNFPNPVIVYTVTGRNMTYTPQLVGEYEVTAINRAKQCGANSMTLNYIVVNINLLNSKFPNESQENDIESPNITPPAFKILHQGQILIRKDNKTYKRNGEIVN